MLVCSLPFRTRGCGCIGHPAFPTPSVGRKIHAQLGRIAPRECEAVPLQLFENSIGEQKLCRPGQAKREPRPITTHGYVARTWGRSPVYNMHRWLWVPAFRGDDKRLNCFGCLKIESVATSTSSRTSERSEREPGPITTNVRVARGRGRSSVYNMHRW